MSREQHKFEVYHHGYITTFVNLRDLKDYARFIRFAVSSRIDDYEVMEKTKDNKTTKLSEWI